jgi:hypothetical protein
MKNRKLIGVIGGMLFALSMPLSAIADGAKAAAPAFSVQTPISDLLANPKAKAVVAKYLPDLPNSEHLSMIEGMSIEDLAAIPQANIDDAKLKEIQADLAQIK